MRTAHHNVCVRAHFSGASVQIRAVCTSGTHVSVGQSERWAVGWVFCVVRGVVEEPQAVGTRTARPVRVVVPYEKTPRNHPTVARRVRC